MMSLSPIGSSSSPRPSAVDPNLWETSTLQGQSDPNAPSQSLRRRPWRKYTTSWDGIIQAHYEGEGTEEAPFIVGWLEDDPENPQTWSESYKWQVTLLASATTLIVSLASSAYSGAIEGLVEAFPGYSDEVYISGLSTFVLGFALGPLLWAPLSEVFGRRNLFILTYLLFTLWNGVLVASQNMTTVIVLRFLSGAVGSSPLTNAGGTISDMFNAEKRGMAISLFSLAPFLGPALGPIIGGFLGESAGFRWVFALIAILTAILTFFGSLWLPETYAPVLLRARAQKLSAATGRVYRSSYERERKMEIRVLFRTSLTRPWQLLFREPIVFLLSLYLAIVYGTLYLLFAAFPIVYQQQRGWSPGVGGLAFVGVLIGFVLGTAYQIFAENPRYVRASRRAGGFAPPEERLVPAMVGAVMMPLGTFWFAWTAAPKSIPWIVSIIAGVPFGFGMVAIFLSIMAYLIDAYLIYAASVLAASAVLRSLFGAAFPLFTAQMYDALGINWASTLVGFLALACTPMPFLFYRYGPVIRARGRYAKQAADVMERIREDAQRQHKVEAEFREEELEVEREEAEREGDGIRNEKNFGQEPKQSV